MYLQCNYTKDEIAAWLQAPQPEAQARMLSWMQQIRTLANEILASRGGKMTDVDNILAASRVELEERSEWITRRD